MHLARVRALIECAGVSVLMQVLDPYALTAGTQTAMPENPVLVRALIKHFREEANDSRRCS
jgi:hypothetical protein